MTAHDTRLARALADSSTEARPTPVDVFRMARRRWLKGQRLNLAELAKEAGIGRATLFRWVGSKDLLMQEILWSLYEPIFREAVEAAGGSGPAHVVEVHRRVIRNVLLAEPMQRFINQDPDYALRILTSSSTVLHERTVAIAREHLEQCVEKGEIRLPIPAHRFAEIITRINKSLMYGDQADDYAQAIDEAGTLMEILLSGGARVQEHA